MTLSYTGGVRWLCLLVLAPCALRAQAPCGQVFTPCDLVFEMDPSQMRAHPNPYLTVELQAEFKSPRARTLLVPGFWDGGNRVVLRLTPTEPGEWSYRLTSNLEGLNNKAGTLSATASELPGFIRPANAHHWMTSGNLQPHLWVGEPVLNLALMEPTAFGTLLTARAAQKITHLRGLLSGSEGSLNPAFAGPDQPQPAHFQRLDANIQALNRAGMVADLVLGSTPTQLERAFPKREQRVRLLRYLVARYASLHITWQLALSFENDTNGRELLKELGLSLKEMDPYQHPRSTGALVTSAPLLPDGWMNYVMYGSSAAPLGAIEHQLYTLPAVQTEAAEANTDAVRRQIWNTTMNGQYPELRVDDAAMSAWVKFFAGTRYWELEPYFDVDGGRAVALEGTEYIVYVEKPAGPVEVPVEKHSYDVRWYNPINGEYVPQKDWKGERFVAEPPDRAHDWVLHLSREGHKEGMLKSYKFESRRVPVQELESDAKLVPFSINEPGAPEVSAKARTAFAASLKRQTRATREMLYLWTGDITADGQGYRMFGMGQKGTFTIPPTLLRTSPSVLNLRLFGLNSYGKLYATDKVYPVNP